MGGVVGRVADADLVKVRDFVRFGGFSACVGRDCALTSASPLMGQQSNKIIKRRRRADYLKRKKEQVKQGGAVKKTVAKKPAAEKAPAAKKPAAKKAPAKKAPAKKAPAKKVEETEAVEAAEAVAVDTAAEGAEQAEA